MAVQGANTRRGRTPQLSYTVVDLGLAIAELVRARDEIRIIQTRRHTGRERNLELAEPLARVELALRFGDTVLDRHERARKKPRDTNHATETQLGASAAAPPAPKRERRKARR